MNIETTRFGNLTIDPAECITFDTGVIGFRNEHAFVLLRSQQGSPIGWLQSTKTGWLALPVVSVEALANGYDDSNVQQAVSLARVGFDANECAVMVVLHPTSPEAPTVNLLAPIVVNVTTRKGAQVILEGTKLTTLEPFALRSYDAPAPMSEQTVPIEARATAILIGVAPTAATP